MIRALRIGCGGGARVPPMNASRADVWRFDALVVLARCDYITLLEWE
jgi:hypothetical protein